MKYSVSLKNTVLKKQINKLKEEKQTSENNNKEIKENHSPNFEINRLITPKHMSFDRIIPNTTKNIDKKQKYFNFDTKKKSSHLLYNPNKEENFQMANLEKVKISHKSFGIISAYSAITTEGFVRDYNEDRVSVIFNVSKPNTYKDDDWPKCSFFGLYDGHGGSKCADFLRDNLHKFIISDSNFPKKPQKAILNGFIAAEKVFLQNSIDYDHNCYERSGSCAIILLIIEKRCYIANVGDSRAIMSSNYGEKAYCLSRDHRPNDEKEYQRVIEAGGKIYQTEASIKNKEDGKSENFTGPLRVMPGKLSISRAIGDIEAKHPDFGGNPNVIIAVPDIKYFDINSNNDFILIGCDGLFDKMKNKEIIDFLWKNSNIKTKDIHNHCGVLAELLVEESIKKKSTDNITVIFISLKENLENIIIDNKNAMTHQIDKVQKRILTEENKSKEVPNTRSILSKIIKISQSKTNILSEKFIPINK